MPNKPAEGGTMPSSLTLPGSSARRHAELPFSVDTLAEKDGGTATQCSQPANVDDGVRRTVVGTILSDEESYGCAS